MFGWLGGSKTDIVESIASGRAILARSGPAGLPRFDASLRDRSLTAPDWFPALFSIRPRDVLGLARRSGDTEAAAVILAAHPSGWVRQAALPLLEECATPLSVGMLVLRAGDWVDPIRLDARSRLATVLENADERTRVRVLPALASLARSDTRATDFATELLALLTARLRVAALIDALTDADRRVRRTAARMLAARGEAGSAVDVALRQDDPVTAWIVALAATEHTPSQALSAQLFASKHPRLRRLGLAGLIDLGGNVAIEAASGGLFDRHRDVRHVAQEHLTRAGSDVRSIYGKALDSSPNAIVGVAETGRADDISLVVPYVVHPVARVRRAIALMIATRGEGRHRETLLQLASDSSRRVARAAITALVSSHPTSTELDALWSLVVAEPAAVIVPRAFTLLDRWTQLRFAFRGIGTGVASEAGARLLDDVMRHWNTSFVAPRAQDAPELTALLPDVLQRLEPNVARTVEVTVRAGLRQPP